MRRILLFLLLFLLLINVKPTYAQRYANCDLCGYCEPSLPAPTILPGNWQACRECLYPNAASQPDVKDTLRIDPNTNIPPTPAPGHQFSMLGCIKTDLGSFREEGAAQSLIQKLLDFIFAVGGALAFAYLLYGAFLILTSQADPERLNQGKKAALGAIVGLIFSLFAVFIIKILSLGILKIPGFE